MPYRIILAVLLCACLFSLSCDDEDNPLTPSEPEDRFRSSDLEISTLSGGGELHNEDNYFTVSGVVESKSSDTLYSVSVIVKTFDADKKYLGGETRTVTSSLNPKSSGTFEMEFKLLEDFHKVASINAIPQCTYGSGKVFEISVGWDGDSMKIQ